MLELILNDRIESPSRKAAECPLRRGLKLIAKLGMRLASLPHGSSAEGQLAIYARLRAKSTSGITATFLDFLIGMGCSDEMHRLPLM